MNLDGQTAIVTGAAKRIGKSIALLLADQGCDVLVHYGNSEDAAEQTAEEIRSKGRRAAIVSADLSDSEAAATTVISACVEELGRPSVLVNSAAIFDSGSLANTDPSNWERHLAINLSAPFYLMKKFAEAMPEDGPGHVVNIVDWRAHEHPTGHLAYTVSKSGLLALTRMTAQELAPKIRVNAIAPGPMLPPPGKDESYMQPVIDKLPMNRSGSPEDIAKAVVYLSESDFVTGTLLHVDGGQQFTGGMG